MKIMTAMTASIIGLPETRRESLGRPQAARHGRSLEGEVGHADIAEAIVDDPLRQSRAGGDAGQRLALEGLRVQTAHDKDLIASSEGVIHCS